MDDSTKTAAPAQTLAFATEPGTARATEANTPADKLDTFLNAVDAARNDIGSAATIEVNRAVSGGGRVPIARISAEDFDPCRLPDRYGPGRYFCRLRIGTKWSGSATFDYSQITPPPVAVGAALAPTPAPTAGAGEQLSVNALLAAMMTTQQQTMQNMTAILTAVLTRDTGPKISELAALMNTGKRSEVGEIVTAIRELSEMQGGGGGEARGEPDDLGALAKLFAPLLAAQAAQPKAAPRTPADRERMKKAVLAELQRRQLARAQQSPKPPQSPPTPPATPAAPNTPPGPTPPPPTSPAAADPRGEQIGAIICARVRSCWNAGFTPGPTAAALIATIDECPGGAQILDAAANLGELELADMLARDAAEFRTGERRSWAESVAEAILDNLNPEDADQFTDTDDDQPAEEDDATP